MSSFPDDLIPEPWLSKVSLDKVSGLSKRQQQALEIIVDRTRRELRCPTLREIGAIMGIRSTNGVNDHLVRLERKGWVVRRDLETRNIILTQKARDRYGLWFSGYVDVFQALYDSEINFSVEAFFDAGFIVRLGDKMNGYIYEGNVANMEGAALMLRDKAIERLPNSGFAKRFGGK